MNIANTNACRKTYLGNNISKELSDKIRYNINTIVFTKTIYDSTSNSIDISLMESTYKLLSPQIINNIRTSLNNIRL